MQSAQTTADIAPRPVEVDTVRVLVFNDHPVFKSALCWKLAEQVGIEFVADTASVDETLRTATGDNVPVDVVIADLRIGDGSSEGIYTVTTLVDRLDPVPVIVYSDFNYRAYATRIFEAGAAAMLKKSAEMNVLADAIRSAAQQVAPATRANGNAA